MTKEEILALEPGPELDRQVALVLGGIMKLPSGNILNAALADYPPFSTDWWWAGWLIEHMRKEGGENYLGCRACIELHSVKDDKEDKPYMVTIWGEDADAAKGPEAIAKATILAKMLEANPECYYCKTQSGLRGWLRRRVERLLIKLS